MNYLYHQVPENIEGGVLYPLNVLRQKNPELYERILKKYQGRSYLMDQLIYPLNCKWNDVLHLTAISPKELKGELVKAGMKPYLMKFYQINPHLLEPEKTTIFLYSRPEKRLSTQPEDFVTYSPEILYKFDSLPEVTKEYYRFIFNLGKLPLMFARVPHVFYKGSLDVKNLPIIEV